jgi:hypothetical protein
VLLRESSAHCNFDANPAKARRRVCRREAWFAGIVSTQRAIQVTKSRSRGDSMLALHASHAGSPARRAENNLASCSQGAFAWFTIAVPEHR